MFEIVASGLLSQPYSCGSNYFWIPSDFCFLDHGQMAAATTRYSDFVKPFGPGKQLQAFSIEGCRRGEPSLIR